MMQVRLPFQRIAGDQLPSTTWKLALQGKDLRLGSGYEERIEGLK